MHLLTTTGRIRKTKKTRPNKAIRKHEYRTKI